MKTLFPSPVRAVLLTVVLLLGIIGSSARAADRDRIGAFLSVTGFDVALNSLRLTASAAPDMLGLAPEQFGAQWTRMADRVFDTGVMHDMAVDILSEALSDELLWHAAGFYATELGQRLVEVENASHMVEDDAAKQARGRALVANMVRTGSGRLEILKRMNKAVDGSGHSVRALQEIRIRFLMAASDAGIVQLRMDIDELRAFMKAQEPELRLSLAEAALAGAAYTYAPFSDAELEEYAQALEAPGMQKAYELMNAVQYAIMANRFEALAAEMSGLQQQQDI